MDKIFKSNTIYNYNTSIIALKENIIEGNIESDLVIFYSTDTDILEKEQKKFLFKMLSAVKHNASNTLVINDTSNISFRQIVKLKTIKKIMFFGTLRKTVGLNLNIKRYVIYNMQNVDFIFIDALSTIKNDNKRKAALWARMKTMFAIQ